MTLKKPKHSFTKHIKKLTWKTYLGSAVIFLIFSLLMSVFFIRALNEYLNEIFINQAISLAESYTHTFDLSTKANDTINELIEERLNVALLGFENHLPDILEDNDHIFEFKNRFNVDEIFVFDEAGAIVASADEAFLGWRLPENHPVQKFKESSDIIRFDKLREASETQVLYKYAYLKTTNNHLVQVGISAENIASMINDFTPKILAQSMVSDDILQADIYLDAQTNFLFKTEHDDAAFDSFEKEALKTNDVMYRFTDQLEAETLQIFVPLYSHDHKIGTLILFHSTAYHKQVLGNTMSLIILIMIAIFLIIAYLLWAHYIKSRNLEAVFYINATSGIYNREYFLKYTKENLHKMRDQNHHIAIVVLNNYIQLKLLHQENAFSDVMRRFNHFVLTESPQNEAAFQFYDDVILLYYAHQATKETFENRVKHFLSQLNAKDASLEVKVGLLEIDERYTSNHDISSNVAASINQLRDPSTPGAYIFTTSIWDQLVHRERLLNDLRSAYLNRFDDEFYVVFQPQIDRSQNRVVGFESLSRWNHPKIGMISPDDFIEIAEKSNLIIPLGERVIEKSLAFLKAIIEHGYQETTVSINVSYAQLKQPHFVEKFVWQMNQAQVPYHCVGLEVTESMFINDYDELNEKLNHLRDLGIQVYLDDFGMGYSHIDRIHNLSIDYIKIDKSFVDMIGKKHAIIEGVLSLTNNLPYPVVVEGVEKLDQIKWLEQHGCTLIQGYYYSQGLTRDEAIKYLDHHYHPDK